MSTRRQRDSLKSTSVQAAELKVDLEREFEHQSNGSKPVEDSSPIQAPVQAIDSFFDLALRELSALRTRAELDAIERAADLILEREAMGGRVHVTGIGKSEHIARYVASLLSSTGTPAYFLHATECMHGSAGQV